MATLGVPTIGCMSNGSMDWLPDRHLVVAASLAHVDEVIEQLGDVLFRYQTQPGGIVDFKEVPAGSVSRTVVARIAPMPRKIPLLVADALVGLRGALEHTLFAEVEDLDGTLEESAAKRVEMPAALTFDKFQEWIGNRGKNAPASLRAGSPIIKRIEGLQPFQRTLDPENHPLAVLTAYTNHTKHRMPAVTAVSMPAMYMHDEAPRHFKDLPRRSEGPLQIGELIAETPMGEQRVASGFPTIGINSPGTDRWPILMAEVKDLSTWVRTQALPRLITGTEPTTLSLPARYDIQSGHVDERTAILLGETVCAAAKHSQRLTAQGARDSLVETIGMLEDAPSPERITAWLASLPDDEVVARASQLKMTTTYYDPEIMLHNVAVLEGMRNDAKRFAGSA